MEEYILSERLRLIREEVARRPLSINLNLLMFSYMTLLKLYDELLEDATNFLMNVVTPCEVAEDFKAVAYIAKGDIPNAQLETKYALSIDPEDPYAHLFRGIIEMVKGVDPKDDLEKALIFFDNNKRDEVQAICGFQAEKEKIALFRGEDFKNAEIIKSLEKVLEKERSNAPLKTNLAEAVLKLGNLEKAKEIINSVIQEYPFYPRALSILTKIYDNENKIEASHEIMRKILQINPLSPYLTEAGRVLDEKETIELNNLKQFFESNNPFLDFFKSTFTVLSPKPQQMEQQTTQEKSHTDKAFEYLECGKYEEALREFLEALKEE